VTITAAATVALAAIAGTVAVLIIRTALAGTREETRAGIITAVTDLIHAVRGKR
jgi:hypothetical protein